MGATLSRLSNVFNGLAAVKWATARLDHIRFLPTPAIIDQIAATATAGLYEDINKSCTMWRARP
jgi:hypothetical protein